VVEFIRTKGNYALPNCLRPADQGFVAACRPGSIERPCGCAWRLRREAVARKLKRPTV